MTKISAVIVAHNEEKKIEDCLKSLDFVEEIVVVLDKCNDLTKEIVQKFTDKIIEGSWDIEGERRNVAMGAASGDWILEIDADERISKKLAQEIRKVVEGDDKSAFIIKVDNYIGTRCVRNGWLRTLGVLQRQSLTYKGFKKYHEDKQIHPTYDLEAEVKFLKNSLVHLVDDDIADLISRFNRYTDWRANDLVFKGKVKKSGLFSFKIRFLKSYLFKKGYKEGVLGFLIAILAGLYPVVSYLKAKKINENS